MSEIELGDTVEDTVTGFRGVVVMEYRYLHGTPRCLVQPKVEYSHVYPSSVDLEYSQLSLVKKGTVKQRKMGVVE